MEERLKKLRISMQKTAFNKLHFSENHRDEIYKKIFRRNESDEDILLAFMQLLVQEKTGYELAKLMRGRGVQKFEDNEGFLYILLHRLEQTGCLHSFWDESKAKYYRLNDKGRKLLRKEEKRQTKKQLILKELLER